MADLTAMGAIHKQRLAQLGLERFAEVPGTLSHHQMSAGETFEKSPMARALADGFAKVEAALARQANARSTSPGGTLIGRAQATAILEAVGQALAEMDAATSARIEALEAQLAARDGQ